MISRPAPPIAAPADANVSDISARQRTCGVKNSRIPHNVVWLHVPVIPFPKGLTE